MTKSDEERVLNISVKYEDAIYGIMRYKEKIEELKAAEKNLADQYKEGTITAGEYKVQVTAMEEMIKEYKENVRGLSKEVQNNIKQEKEQEGSLRALRAELSNATKEYDSLSKAEREGARGHALRDHINDITNQLKSAEEETTRFYRNVGNYENSIKNALGVNNQFAESLLRMSQNGGGIQGMFGQASVAASAFGKTLLGLLTNPVFVALAGIVGVGVAFKWFYDYNKGVEEATRLTREFLGLSGDELKAMRSEIQATADMFGKDYVEVLQTVDSLVAQYGMSAQEALKIVNDGFVAGADLSGSMLSQIQQYGPSFHDAGIAADEMVAIIAQTRSGIFSDKGLDLIQMASKRIREMAKGTADSLDAIGISSKQVEQDLQSGAKSTFDVIQEISSKLREMPQDSQVVGSVLKDVFGKQGAAGGLKMIEQLDTMTKKIEDVKAVTGEYGKEQERLLEANAEMNKRMSALFDMSDKGFGEMMLRVKTLTSEGISKFLDGLISGINYFINLYNKATVFRGGVELIVAAVKSLWEVFKMVFNLIIDGFKLIGREAESLFDVVEGILTFDADKIAQGAKGLVGGVVKSLGEGVDDVKKAGVSLANGYVDAFNRTMRGARIDTISIPEASETDGSGSGGVSGSGVSGRSGSGLGSKTDKNKADKLAKEAAEAKKKELEEIRKAEDLLYQLTVQTAEQKREAIKRGYDRQIEDLRIKLATDKNLTTEAQNAIMSQMESLVKIRDEKMAEFDRKRIDERIRREQAYNERMLTVVRQGSEQEYQLRYAKIENERQLALSSIEQSTMSEEEKQRNIWAIKQQYNQMFAELEDERSQNEIDAIKKRYEEKRLEAEVNGNDELEQLRINLEEKAALLEEAQQMETETAEEFNNRKLQLQSDYNKAKKALVDAEVQMEQAKMQAYAGVFGGLSKLANAFASENEGLAKAAKVLALAEIAINTGVALAQGIKQAQSVPYPANLVAIATTVGTVLGNVASAVSMVQSAKFAQGGAVEGPGTETSDSIPAMLSNGESVLTAQATRMFAPVLSSFNQIGGGVPISVQGGGSQVGEDFLANAVAKGMAMAPRPVVSVSEINDVENRVEVLEDISTV